VAEHRKRERCATMADEQPHPDEASTLRRQAEEDRDRVLNASLDLICIAGMDGRFRYVNPAWETALGYSTGELLSQPFLNFIHPDDHHKNDLEIAKLAAGEPSVGFENRYMHRDGTIRTISWTASPVPERGLMYCVGRDITERKRMEDALKESENRLRSVLENMSLIGLMLDPIGNITLCNDHLLSLTGWTRNEVMGQSWFELFVPADLRAEVEQDVFLTHISTGEVPARHQNEIITRAGERRLIAWNNTVLKDLAGGAVTGVACIGEDITERGLAEEALHISESRYRTVVETANEAIIVAQDGRLKFVNPMACSLVGYTEHELASVPFAELIAPEDREMVVGRYLQRLAGKRFPDHYSFRIVPKDGAVKWVEIGAVSIEWEGRPATLNFLSDITERKSAEEALRRALALQEAIFEGSRDAVFISDAASRFVAVNGAACELTGYSAEELLSMRIPDLHEQVDLHAFEAYHDSIMAGAEVLSEAPTLRKDGRKVETEFNNRRIFVDGKALMHTTARDITSRKRAEGELQESRERYQNLARISPVGIFRTDEKGATTYVNPRWCRLSGLSVDEALGDGWLSAVHPDDRKGLIEGWRESSRLARESFSDYRLVRADGTVVCVMGQAIPETNAENEVVGYVGTITDITERKRAEEALRESEERYRQLVEMESDAVLLVDNESGRILEANGAAATLYGFTREELLARKNTELSAQPEETQRVTHGTPVISDQVVTIPLRIHRKKDGTEFPVEITGRFFESRGRPVHIAAIRDITERRRAEEALRASLERFELASRATFNAIWDWNLQTDALAWNENVQKLFGYQADEIEPGIESWTTRIHPGDLDRVNAGIHAAIDSGRDLWSDEYRFRRRDGTYAEVADRGCITRDVNGNPVRMIGAMDNITERKRAEAALAQSQAQLLQSQKLEAVGRLAGGVAHDFNNILQAMLSLATVLRIKAGSPELTRIVAEVETLIKRGAGLTQQLLLFSRRQVVEKKRLDLGELASAASVLLRRLIPANMRLAFDTTPDRLWVDGDTGQLQQVLMNLAVNAKDAMPGGGTLTVRTKRSDGEAVLEVIDTGHGMDEEARSHLFEPFFTTKEIGKGTGLGLSVAHGLVEQHGGRIEVESVPGEGSVFRVILPAMPAPDEAADEPSEETEVPRGHGERVLIVEDEDGARKGLAELLTILGYAVTAVGSGEEAGVLPVEPAPDLLLTDLMLPGIDGAALAAGLRDRWPGIKVVLMSGYTEDEAVRRGVNEGEVRFLQKPFDMLTLARALRAALDTSAAA